ncbi:tetratricopeptide repeat protein [Dactylosporangium sp. AC04546]|uniref:transcriptional regulator n=1 Tax=Dactylosporangium sp. AC04546 TaxID=2862460 RepID=UPI001EDEFE64|nr:transcriptional regulator [Dactylosporangium sp. AC04546]WVK83516.1 tetratricopeptide repeat protein [Dactylosporangium sp. AC04546]
MTTGIGARILALRTSRGLTQRDLAEPNYTAAYVSSVENGHRVPSSDALAHFAARLSVDVAELTTGRRPGEALELDIELLTMSHSQQWYSGIAASSTEPGERRAEASIVLGRLESAVDTAAAHFERAHRLLADAPPHHRAAAVAGRAWCARRQGDPGYAAYLLGALRDELVRAGLPAPGALLAVQTLLGLCQNDLGEDAGPAVAAALELAPAGDPARAAELHLTVARTLAATGDPTGAAAALDAARQARLADWLAGPIAEMRRLRGRSRLAAGDLGGALADLTAALAGLPGDPDLAADLAVTYRALGSPATAAALLADVPFDTAAVHRARALLDAGSAEGHLRAAIALLKPAGPRRDLADAVLALADHLTTTGRAEEALDTLAGGLAAVDALGRPS